MRVEFSFYNQIKSFNTSIRLLQNQEKLERNRGGLYRNLQAKGRTSATLRETTQARRGDHTKNHHKPKRDNKLENSRKMRFNRFKFTYILCVKNSVPVLLICKHMYNSFPCFDHRIANPSSVEFNDIIHSNGLIEPTHDGNLMSWSNNQHGSDVVYKRLDRCVINHAFVHECNKQVVLIMLAWVCLGWLSVYCVLDLAKYLCLLINFSLETVRFHVVWFRVLNLIKFVWI
jgi:hypothetical protein